MGNDIRQIPDPVAHLFIAMQRHYRITGHATVGAAPVFNLRQSRRKPMGRGILLWLLGVPIPIILLLALIWH
ncbi:hypothetical protein EOD42_16450 [Rhodovarius crocodyli]|uniref:Uncharacterized protein n=1 Tax=Rhodovarius crocodyli TaxID=1979269 RepID=A0A437MDU5_9PROT|nr:hypothetical protein [Rhodovarius crocodyli]RVT95780.1 hypothetical protein EOD42_16450 [Rhodovarius crocodyli]